MGGAKSVFFCAPLYAKYFSGLDLSMKYVQSHGNNNKNQPNHPYWSVIHESVSFVAVSPSLVGW